MIKLRISVAVDGSYIPTPGFLCPILKIQTRGEIGSML